MFSICGSHKRIGTIFDHANFIRVEAIKRTILALHDHAIVGMYKSWSQDVWTDIFGSIVYNRTKAYIHQTILRVVVHLINIDQWSLSARLYEIHLTDIYSRAILVTLTSECHGKLHVSVKPELELEHWQTVQNPDDTPQNAASDQGLYCYLNYRKLRVKSPFRNSFQPSLRDNRLISDGNDFIFTCTHVDVCTTLQSEVRHLYRQGRRQTVPEVSQKTKPLWKERIWFWPH